jgi:SdpI/YfhL protein family
MTAAVVIAAIAFALSAGAFAIAQRSGAGKMSTKGPGIRLPETMRCEHTWQAAQLAVATPYRYLAGALFLVGALALLMGALDLAAFVIVVIAIVLATAATFFYVGVAITRSKKAAGSVRCEHRSASAPKRKAKGSRR